MRGKTFRFGGRASGRSYRFGAGTKRGNDGQRGRGVRSEVKEGEGYGQKAQRLKKRHGIVRIILNTCYFTG